MSYVREIQSAITQQHNGEMQNRVDICIYDIFLHHKEICGKNAHRWTQTLILISFGELSYEKQNEKTPTRWYP